MDNRSEVRDFLTSRRGRVTAEQAGLPDHGPRRVPGLRRSEVAQLAGVSVEYYTQLERGNLRGASESVLDALARGLRLDEVERAHLFDLARAANVGATVRRRPTTRRVRPGIQAILDTQLCPAWVGNRLGDVLATNALGAAVLSPLYRDAVRPVNVARFRFLDPRAADYYRDWDETAHDIVAGLRMLAGRNPYDKVLTDLIGELSTRSEEFRSRWAAHEVHLHRSGVKRLHHPEVGDLELAYEALELPADDGLVLFIFTAEAGSPTRQALDLLASLAAMPAPAVLEQPRRAR